MELRNYCLHVFYQLLFNTHAIEEYTYTVGKRDRSKTIDLILGFKVRFLLAMENIREMQENENATQIMKTYLKKPYLVNITTTSFKIRLHTTQYFL